MAIPRAQYGNWLHRWVWVLFDGALWFVAIYTATWLRFDFTRTDLFVDTTATFAIAAGLGHLLIGGLIGPYRAGHKRGPVEQTPDLVRSVLVTTIILSVWALLTNPQVLPRSVPAIGGVLVLVGMFAVRFLIRSWHSAHTATGEDKRRVIVFGAGAAGRRVLRSMARDQQSGLSPVALLDDDRSKQRLRIDGVRVRGTRKDIGKVAHRFDATALAVALPQADAELIRDLTDLATAADIDVLILPPLREIIGVHPSARDLRDVKLEDLLSRRPVSMDTTTVAEQFTGRSILVTGAGGSIGSELCRQIARFGPAKLFLLDQDESSLQATQMSLAGQVLLRRDEVILADIRDVDSLRTVFRHARPDIVFHAAALKHLPLLESYPFEAWKTNVLGTANVLTAAAEAGVGIFVNISTDKAADPTCVLGYSKRLAERLTADFARTQPGLYISVRFGNVLGSSGSVIHAFTAQIDAGGPITLTHPDVERFFMLIPQACQLVLEAASIGTDGEVMVLEMGKQVKILDVATILIRLSGRKDIEINYSGLRPGEKISEGLFSTNEQRHATTNPLVTSVDVPTLSVYEVQSLPISNPQEAVDWMRNQSTQSENAEI